MAPIAGWYDDPRDGDKLRYWDGAAWTEHVTAKQQTQPDSATPVFPGAVEAQQQTWRYGQPPEQAQAQQQRQEQSQAPPWPGQQQGPQQPTDRNHQQQYPEPWPPQPPQPPQQPQQPWPQQQQPPWPQQPWQQGPWPAPPAGGVWTPDGARVTSWGKRFAARLLDGIFVFLGSLPLTGYFFYRSAKILSDQMSNGTYHAFSPSSDVLKWELVAVGIIVVVEVCYEAFSLRLWNATPGKRTLGISVRRWDQGGRLPWPTILKRVGFIYGLSAISLVPAIGILASIVGLVNYLFPLWDKRRQALHDKVANTVVVEGAPTR